MAILALPLIPAAGAQSEKSPQGLPFTRFYAFDEMGDVGPGARLTFDGSGRIVAAQDGSFVALNDNAWLDLASKDPRTPRIQQATRDQDGTNYYGSQGSCGVLRRAADGKLVAESFLPKDLPAWVGTNSFTEILCRPEGVYFGGFNGFVFWDRNTKRTVAVEVSGLACLFNLGDDVFASSHTYGVQKVDIKRGRVGEPLRDVFENRVIDHAARLGDGRTLLSTTWRSLVVYANGELAPFPGPPGSWPDGHVTALYSLAEGGVAVAVAEKGLYILSPDGGIAAALTGAEYHRINSLAADEPGVLWAATERGLVKILYGTPLTWFGQALGLPVQWPQVVNWQGSVVIASNGRVYEPAPGNAGEPTSFSLVSDQPGTGTWGITTSGRWLLLGNGDGLYGRRPGEPIRRFLPAVDAARLAMIGDVCLTIGAHEIAAFRCDGDVWRECATRVPSFGYPAVVHAGKTAAWVEIGANRVMRIAFRDGKIVTRLFDTFPWSASRWVNVSVLDDLTILTGPGMGRLFFDEKSEALVTHPPIEQVLEHAPFAASRITRDTTGALWLSHDHGLIRLIPEGNGYRADRTTYRFITDHIPLVRALPNGEIWITGGRSLYRAKSTDPAVVNEPFNIALVSMRDTRTQLELTNGRGAGIATPLAFAQNSLALRFFAGSYASRRAPAYEYRVNQGPWNNLETASLVQLTDLREGSYRVFVRLVDNGATVGAPLAVEFSIAPPWYRTWAMYFLYALLVVAVVFVIVRIALRRARARNATLESVVAKRTEELKAAMEKLQEETEVAATLAERNRLAGEIHDSLEQGFSGLMLHLETVAGMPGCSADIERGLAMARSMVGFSRNEVRHAVWDLHSPLLESGGLEAALKNIVAHLAPEPMRASIAVTGAIRPVGSKTEHHFLRIGQEAITNAVKHAGATHLEIQLAFANEEVSLRVRDDGCGFDPRTPLDSAAGHFGLRSLRSRANAIGGRLEIQSAPGAGTTVIVTAPLVFRAI